MANTYTQLYIQFVFAVKYRKSLILPSWKDSLYKYMTGIIQNHRHKLIVINGMPDHVHILVGLHPNQSLSDLMKFAKGESSEWINKNRITPEKFYWQEGFGAFSYSRSQIKNVIHYIENQESHHQKQSFREEYIEQLKTFDIDFNEQYIFHDLL